MSIAVDLGSGVGAGLALVFTVAYLIANLTPVLDYLNARTQRGADRRLESLTDEVQGGAPVSYALWPGSEAAGHAPGTIQPIRWITPVGHGRPSVPAASPDVLDPSTRPQTV